jgi:hypothetical protein
MHLVPMISVPDCLRGSVNMQADDSVYDVLLGMYEEGQFAAVAATTRAIIYSKKYQNLGARPHYIACLWFLRAVALMEMGDVKVAISSFYAARSIFIRHGSTRKAYINVTVALFYAETLAGGTDTDLLSGILGTMNALEEAYRLELITLHRALAMRSQTLGKTSESMAHIRTARDHTGKLALTHPKFALQLQNAIEKSVPTP